MWCLVQSLQRWGEPWGTPRSARTAQGRVAPGRRRPRVRPPPLVSGLLCAGDEVDGILDGREVGDLFVGDANFELLLGERDDRHHRQRVDVEVVGERIVQLHGNRGQAGLFVDDVSETAEELLLAVGHVLLHSGSGCGTSGNHRAASRGRRSQGTTTTWAAYARPAPKPICRAISPLRACPSRTRRSVARGIEAAEVLPVSAMSRAMTTLSGSFSCLASWSMMRMFAWWGMNTSISSGEMPAASIARAATFAISKLAHLNTVGPFWRSVGHDMSEPSWKVSQLCVARMASAWEPSDPQIVGPIPGDDDGPTTRSE